MISVNSGYCFTGYCYKTVKITHREALRKLDDMKGFSEKQGLDTAEIWHLQEVVHDDANTKTRNLGEITDFFY